MSTVEELTALLHSDVDEVLVRARKYDSRARYRLMRAAVDRYSDLSLPAERVKAVWALQALLASTRDRQLPTSTSMDVAQRLATITRSPHEVRDARRGALDSLALVFLKSRQMSKSLHLLIHSAFFSAARSQDVYMKEFAQEALSGEGVLARRMVRKHRRRFAILQARKRA